MQESTQNQNARRLLLRSGPGGARRGGPALDADAYEATWPGIGISSNNLRSSVSAGNVIEWEELGRWQEVQSLAQVFLERPAARFSLIHSNLAPGAF